MNNEYFKGQTKATIQTLREDVRELHAQVESINHRVWLILLAMVALLAEKAPNLIIKALAYVLP